MSYHDDNDFSLGISRVQGENIGLGNDEQGGEYYPLNDDFLNSQNRNDHEGIEMLHENISNNRNNTYYEEHTLLEKNTPSLPPVHNLDVFLTDVYNYFRGKGFLCITLNGLFDLVSSLFVVIFFTFLVSFINYSVVFGNDSMSSLSQSVDFQRKIPFWLLVFLGIFSLFWLYKLCIFLYQIKNNLEIREFYRKNLMINEDDIQTVEWREVVNKLKNVQRISNVNESGLSALEIANRIMRKDNYFIYLFNENILNLDIPFPFLGGSPFVTKSIEWCLMYSLFNYVFDENGVVKQELMAVENRQRLATGLSRRFMAIGLVGLFASPFIFFFLLINFFFEYAEAIKNDPGTLFSREWTPFAQWKFREFNELPHYFQNRLNLSYQHANLYVSSFPSEILSHLAKFISFIVGSFLAILILFGIYNDNFLLNYEIFGRSAIWYAGIFGTAIAICRSLITDSNQVFQPVKHMARVYQHTHYLPKSWKGKCHTHQVRNEFLELFEYRLIAFVKEISSVVIAPFILMFSLPKCSYGIIEGIGKSTVHLEAVGLVCLSSTFKDVRKVGGNKYGTFSGKNNANFIQSKEGKLAKSMVNFKANNPEWKPERNEYMDDLSRYAQQLKPTDAKEYLSNSIFQHPKNNQHDIPVPPSTSVDDIQFIYDSNYVSPKVLNSVLGNDDGQDSVVVDQNLINMVNNLQSSFYQYTKSNSSSTNNQNTHYQNQNNSNNNSNNSIVFLGNRSSSNNNNNNNNNFTNSV
ncbi:autophagy protein 9 [Tieghemostelium lacteum]|uniref:Autophagy-related protein 9 n=1 Tax=Tieghemostelium lacteum TaxID=361077 RepID=A0A151ZIT9_TIELA|nr:autophagy protein 9 [Tieghemostelium lacteum]|eukprot:KYQ93800.1 autophagy protein 9 [Tieghemostelium lacteum]